MEPAVFPKGAVGFAIFGEERCWNEEFYYGLFKRREGSLGKFVAASGLTVKQGERQLKNNGPEATEIAAKSPTSRK